MAVLLTVAGCGPPPPPATPAPDELPSLQSRAQRSRTDTEAVLRLAAGLWGEGDEEAAATLLSKARAAVPEQPAYAAALGTALDRRGDYLAARDEYIAFVTAAAAPDLASVLSSRVEVIRGETAGALIARLNETRRRLNHGLDPSRVAALPLFGAPPDDPESARLAAAVTELLVESLRHTDFYVLDWELAQAARESIAEDVAPEEVAFELGEILDARHVVLGSVEPMAADTVAFTLDVFRVNEIGGMTRAREPLWVHLGEYAEDPTVLAARVFELLLGASRGSARADLFEPLPAVPTEALLLYGEGLLARRRGARAVAGDLFTRAAEAAPEVAPLERSLAEWRADEAFRESPTLPFADEVQAFARRRSDALYLLRRAGSEGPVPLGVTRHGIGEAFGLDRLGSQVFLDFVVTIAGGGQ